jgi:Uma2 family endonuclease
MSAALKWNLMSERDYLATELASTIKHEYVGGVLYAMAGVRVVHDVISGNILGELYGRLRGKPCRPHTSDMKIRIQMPGHVRFYYPDVSVICQSNPRDSTFQEEPVVIFEVLSKSTRRVDLGEKKDGYLAIPSLCVYVLVEQDAPIVVAFRRTDAGFVREVYEGLDAVLPLGEIKTELPLSEIYGGAEFVPERDDEDDAGDCDVSEDRLR